MSAILRTFPMELLLVVMCNIPRALNLLERSLCDDFTQIGKFKA